MSTDSSASLISLEDLDKTYLSNGVKACDQVSMDVTKGTIHMVVGENGAGKSTLMKILSGDFPPDSGTIRLRGREVRWKDTRHALDHGIGMLHQILHFFPGLTVRDHLMLDMKGSGVLSPLNRRKADRLIEQISTSYHITCKPNDRFDDLSSEARQAASLMMLIYRGCEVFILDEPPRNLLQTARKLKEEGKTLIIITHNLQDALDFGDTITVMRRGRHEKTLRAHSVTAAELSALVMGERNLELTKRRRPHTAFTGKQEVITLSQLSGGRPGSADRVHNISLSVHAGETVAVVGIRDNGLRAMEALSSGYEGLGYMQSGGSVSITGKAPHLCTADEVGRIPSDRLEIGSSIMMSVTENLLIEHRRSRDMLNTLGPVRWYSTKALENMSKRIIRDFAIEGRPHYPLITLSGGNIQKLITGRALESAPRALICADISWGLDVKTRSMLFSHIDSLKREGMAVLMFTSEIDAALEEADRIAVLKRGELAGILTNTENLQPAEIGALML
ncbi:MAG: ATP-binding cassette domain-containing protein [Spirochaetota bacterium]